MKSKSGFTLIEVLVVIAVIALLAATVAFTFIATLNSSRTNRRNADLKTLILAMKTYYGKNGSYPITCVQGSGLNNDCNNLIVTYPTYPSNAPSVITPNMSATSLKSIFPALDPTFSDPLGSSTTPLNHTLISGGAIQPDGYYLLSTDLIEGTFTQTFATKTGSTFTCTYSPVDNNFAGQAGTRTHGIVLGAYSETISNWVFYFVRPSADQDVLNWNTANISTCNATEFTS